MADGSAWIDAHALRVRALFLSDLHLGTRDCHADRLLELLERCDADTLYLVGDVVDGWRLKARWHWPPSHDAIVRCLLAKQQTGTRILYIPGNHDEFLRHSAGLHIGGIEVLRETVHTGADGGRYLVLHGDEFDPLVRRVRWLAALGIWVYAAAVLGSDAFNRWRRRARRRRGGDTVRGDGPFESAALAEAARRGMRGIICGHSHRPALLERDGLRYVNTGDWIEACSAVAENFDGSFILLRWPLPARTREEQGSPRASGVIPQT